MSIASNLVGMMFSIRDYAHIEHLATTSYARHAALNEVYEGIVDFADEFAETYQGMYGLFDSIPRVAGPEGIAFEVRFLNLAEWIENNRNSFAGNKDKPLQTIFDDILVFIYKKLYKLNNLK